MVDPHSGYDGPGGVITMDGIIGDISHKAAYDGLSSDTDVIDCGGAMLAPGLVDLRVKTGEPGAEPKETLKSAARAAAAGGVTSIVVQPGTDRRWMTPPSSISSCAARAILGWCGSIRPAPRPRAWPASGWRRSV